MGNEEREKWKAKPRKGESKQKRLVWQLLTETTNFTTIQWFIAFFLFVGLRFVAVIRKRSGQKPTIYRFYLVNISYFIVTRKYFFRQFGFFSLCMCGIPSIAVKLG